MKTKLKISSIIFIADIVIAVIAIMIKSWGLVGFCIIIAIIVYTLKRPIDEFNK